MLSFGPRTPGVRDRYREEDPAPAGQNWTVVTPFVLLHS